MTKEHFVAGSRLLQELNTCINEDQASSSISRITKEVEKIEAFSGRSLHTIKMRNEIAKLEDQLSYSKDQANLRTQHSHQTGSED